MLLGYFCAALHDLSIRYWGMNTDIEIGAVGVDTGVVSSRINGKTEGR